MHFYHRVKEWWTNFYLKYSRNTMKTFPSRVIREPLFSSSYLWSLILSDFLERLKGRDIFISWKGMRVKNVFFSIYLHTIILIQLFLKFTIRWFLGRTYRQEYFYHREKKWWTDFCLKYPRNTIKIFSSRIIREPIFWLSSSWRLKLSDFLEKILSRGILSS